MASAEPRAMPATVRSALMLLWPTFAIAVAASVAYYATSGLPLGIADVGGHLLGYVLLALLLLGMGARNPWARILFVVFLTWKLVLAALNLVLQSSQLPWLYGLDLALLLVQCGAAALLFRPAGNAWFRLGA